MHYSQCQACTSHLHDAESVKTACEVLPRAKDTQSMVRQKRNHFMELCKTCKQEKNIQGTEFIALEDAKETLVFGSETKPDAYSKTYPNDKINVEGHTYGVTAVISYKEIEISETKKIPHYYCTLKVGKSWYEVNDSNPIREVPPPQNGYLFFYERDTKKDKNQVPISDPKLPIQSTLEQKANQLKNVPAIPSSIQLPNKKNVHVKAKSTIQSKSVSMDPNFPSQQRSQVQQSSTQLSQEKNVDFKAKAPIERQSASVKSKSPKQTRSQVQAKGVQQNGTTTQSNDTSAVHCVPLKKRLMNDWLQEAKNLESESESSDSEGDLGIFHSIIFLTKSKC